MTENKIKEMLKDIIDNDAIYECRFEGDPPFCNNEWIPYSLGDAIHFDWKYRKVEKWCVTTNMECFELDYLKSYETPIFIGSKEECKKFVLEHNKTWVEKECEKFEKRASKSSLSPIIVYDSVCTSIKEFSEKLLKEIHNKSSLDSRYATYGDEFIWVEQISKIIKDLGVDLC